MTWRAFVQGVNGYGSDSFSISLIIQLNAAEFNAAVRQDQRSKGQRSVPCFLYQRRAPTDWQTTIKLRNRGDSSIEDEKLGLKVDFSALDINGMWPASARPNATSSYVDENEVGTMGVEFFKRFERQLGPEVDPMLLSAVAGVVHL